jgi:hypothetical protein
VSTKEVTMIDFVEGYSRSFLIYIFYLNREEWNVSKLWERERERERERDLK